MLKLQVLQVLTLKIMLLLKTCENAEDFFARRLQRELSVMLAKNRRKNIE